MKHKKLLNKLVAFTLVFSVTATSLNLEEAVNAYKEPEPEILSELAEERTLSSKTFLLSDGTFLVAQYDTPVHYQ